MLAIRKIFRLDSNSALLIGATLLLGGAFKVAAFAREAFIAAKFGLSAVTDAYFGLQQFPLILATFMFGAFALAFTPAYANGRRSGMVTWLPGLLFYGCLMGAALSALMLAAAPLLLHALHIAAASEVQSTLAILAACYIPIVCAGIWSGICTAQGRNLLAMSVSGLPYLIMTLALFALYVFGRLNNLSLPISMTAGFGLIGLCSLICIVRSQPFPVRAASVLRVWSFPDFRAFFWQLGASSIENGGFAVNQLLMLYFVSRAGTGALSANNCAMRIGLLGFSLLASPLALLVQAQLCAAAEKQRPALFRRWICIVLSGALLLALTLLLLRVSVIRMVYMHGKFQGAELRQVAELLPAWLGYFLVMSANAIVARYLFIREQGRIYVRRQLAAYGIANLLRLGISASAGAAWVIWCSVITEASAVVLNLRTCVTDAGTREIVPALAARGEVL